jgi:DNA helicase-2/ATP-dependent DNA helicase PcrA
VARDFDDTDLGAFLEQVALVSDVDDLEEDPNAPTLLTLHSAKGLEFPVVFIVGMEDGLLPHSRALEDGEELAEERRLFYVGLTRAKDQVILSHAFRRMTYGGVEVSIPSRFLRDIPAGLVDGGSSRQRRRETTQRVSSWQWTPPPAVSGGASSRSSGRSRSSSGKALPEPNPWSEAAAPLKQASYGQQRYRSGQKVSHQKFGGGIVIESKLTGNDEEVVVAFKEVGIKKLIASIAKLELRD